MYYQKTSKKNVILMSSSVCIAFLVAFSMFLSLVKTPSIEEQTSSLYFAKKCEEQGTLLKEGFGGPDLFEGTTLATEYLQAQASINPDLKDLQQDNENDSQEELFYTTYKVKNGDIIGKLAEKFNISVDTIFSVNNIKNDRAISINTMLKIPSMTGIMYTVKEGDTIDSIAEKFNVSAEKIANVHGLKQDEPLIAKKDMFIPDACLSNDQRKEITGTFIGYPIWGSYRLTSYFGYRKNPFTGAKSFHNGIDMAIAQGTAVHAAESGIVVASGWDTVYGNYIQIKHDNGLKTLYGHMVRRVAFKGERVARGQKIGEVGSTGWSTGPHLHFTVWNRNGATINPITMLK